VSAALLNPKPQSSETSPKSKVDEFAEGRDRDAKDEAGDVRIHERKS
jgi:hypothetical protein